MKPINTNKGIFICFFNLLTTLNCVISQNVKFTCYFKSACSEKVTPLKKITLSNSDTCIFSNDDGECNVSALGTYTIYSTELVTGVESPQVSFTYFGIFRDTVQSWALYPVLLFDGMRSNGVKTGDWLCCGNRCNGYYTDYYINGNKRVEGKFKKGKPVGKVQFYNEAGKLRFIVYYNKRGRKIKSEQIKR